MKKYFTDINNPNKRKILFVVPELSHGGSNKCLENMISLLDNQFSISIVSVEPSSELDHYYNVFHRYLIDMPWLYQICRKLSLLRKCINACHNYLHIDIWALLHEISARVLQRKHRFDIAVGFQESYATHFASHFSCKKIAWVHCDYDDYKIRSNNLNEEKWYCKFETIVGVSQYTADIFIKNYPLFANRQKVIYNPLDSVSVQKESKQIDVGFDNTYFNIVSVGRFAEVKQFHIIPNVVKSIIEKQPKLRFCWYIIGDGDITLIGETKRKIEQYGLEKVIYLLGGKNNPYPYIQQSNLLVCTSRSEVCPYVVNEAKALHTPVLTTDFPSAYEIVSPMQTGLIVSKEQLVETITRLAHDENGLYTQLKECISHYEYDNSEIVDALEELLA